VWEKKRGGLRLTRRSVREAELRDGPPQIGIDAKGKGGDTFGVTERSGRRAAVKLGISTGEKVGKQLPYFFADWLWGKGQGKKRQSFVRSGRSWYGRGEEKRLLFGGTNVLIQERG